MLNVKLFVINVSSWAIIWHKIRFQNRGFEKRAFIGVILWIIILLRVKNCKLIQNEIPHGFSILHAKQDSPRIYQRITSLALI